MSNECIELNLSELKYPIENGWYLCKFSYDSQKAIESNTLYMFCDCIPMLLYWNRHYWTKSPNIY